MSYELFINGSWDKKAKKEAWAKHRGKYKEPPEYTKLKGNFRSAMKRSLDFEQIKSINTLQQGNYKIFKICSKEEVETRRNEEKATVYADSPDNLSPVASIKIMPPHAVLLNEQIPNNITVSTSSNCEKYVPVVDSLLNNSKTPYSLKELRCDDIERFFNDSQRIHSKEDISLKIKKLLYENNMKNIADNDLSTFVIKVSYKNIVCKRDTVCLRSSQFRYCHGNVRSQITLFERSNPVLCNYESMPLDKHACDDTVNSILKNFEQGLTIELNTQKMEVVATRFCMSAVYHCANDPVKLVRKKPVGVLSLYECINKLLIKLKYKTIYDRNKILSSLTSELVIGTKPHISKLVSIKIRPVIAEKIASCFSKKAQGFNMTSINADTPSIQTDLPK